MNSDRVQYTEDAIIADYIYDTSVVETSPDGQMTVQPKQELIKIKTDIKVPRTGVMMVGWGGNNGTTVTAAILANRHNISYRTKHGIVVSLPKLHFICVILLEIMALLVERNIYLWLKLRQLEKPPRDQHFHLWFIQ